MHADESAASTEPASTPEESDDVKTSATFPIVGVGASAGGLDALKLLLRALPVDTGMGFVIVQHLAPGRASGLVAILARATKMPVCEVGEDCGESAVEPDHIYVIPPGRDMVIVGGKLRLFVQERLPLHRGVDQFFRSLAQDCGHKAIGVVLSGALNDGTLGLEEIKATGGITFAQDESAQNDSMPRSAVASGCVDFVLPPEKIAEEIARIARHPYVARESEPPSDGEERPSHARIAEIVQATKGVDFTHYKANTLHRRITRRMVLHKLETVKEYEAHLEKTPEEVEALYQDILINVTSFFRDPEAFEVLAATVFPRLLAGRARQEPLRVWTLGCSTGEEAYSLAMLITECAEAAGSQVTMQILATDLNSVGVAKARTALYPKSIVQDVSQERLARFFTEESDGYRICKAIRERCIFSQHNVLADPPFSRVDFISCRNVLIYMESVLQQQIMHLLHYALKPGGVLWLGTSETAGSARTLFEVEDARHKIYTRQPGASSTDRRFRSTPSSTTVDLFARPAPDKGEPPRTDLHKEAERILLSKYAPPGVVISAGMEIVQFRGDTGLYLTPSPGLASLHLLKMLREGLLVGVRAAILRAGKEGRPIREEGLRVKSESGPRDVAVEVIPIKASAAKESGFLVLFDSGTAPARSEKPPAAPAAETELSRLTQELAATREYLQAVIEQQESVNEELQSANEEAQSANEEMQSINEELETSKEEIQSSNEELATVNEELSNTSHELTQLNISLRLARDYAESIVASVRWPLVVLDATLRVKTASAVFYKTFYVAPEATEGRLIYDLGNRQWNIPALRTLLEELLPQKEVIEDFEVLHTFEQIGPRAMLLNARRLPQSAGREPLIVLAIEDITERKRMEEARSRSEALFNTLIESAPFGVYVVDSQFRMRQVSPAAQKVFKNVRPLIGRDFHEIMQMIWPEIFVVEVMQHFRHTLETGEPYRAEDFTEKRQDIPNTESYDWKIERITLPDGLFGVVCYFYDITERMLAEATLRESVAFNRSIIESSPDCIKVLDLEGNLLSMESGQALLGIPDIAPYLNHSWIDLWEGEHRQAAQAAVEAAVATGCGKFVGSFRTLRGEPKWWDVAISQILGAEGKVERLLAVSRDVTERRALEDSLIARASELAQADRSKDEFLAMLAHELRNPLAPMRNAAEILKGAETTAEESVQAQGILSRQIENMTRMIDDLLDISRITEGKIGLRCEPVALETILEAAACLARTSCTPLAQEFTLTLPAEPIFLHADATRLEQVFGNLLTNACKYSGQGSHITLSAERAASRRGESPGVIVRVRDDGHGIAPELLPHIFDLFVQASRALDRAHGGLGIGLTLVQRLVKLHGGSVEARSEGLGKGCEFIVHLPILPGVAAAPPHTPMPAVMESPRRMLIVDDNVDSTRSMAILQKRRGHDTRTAFTGPEAVAAAAEFLPEVVLLDIGLPGMDGYEVARRLRAMPELAGVFLVAISGYGSLEDIARARAAGFDEYLVKPMDLGQLREWLRGREAGV